jgi:hypothetical protein
MILVVYNPDNVKITSYEGANADNLIKQARDEHPDDRYLITYKDPYEDATPSPQEQISALNDAVNSILMGGE